LERIFDSIDGDIQIPMIIRNFDFYGEEIESRSIYFEDKIFIPPRDNNARLNDNTTIAAVIEQLANDEINYSTIIWMDNFGDTLFTKRFSSPYYIEGVDQTNFILPTCIICSPDGQYIYFRLPNLPLFQSEQFYDQKTSLIRGRKFGRT
jgi:hypothetical protein